MDDSRAGDAPPHPSPGATGAPTGTPAGTPYGSLSDELRALYLHIFDSIDSNKDGYVTKLDIASSMRRMENCADADHKAVHVIRAFDLDRDGRISRDEWLTNLASFPQPTPDQLAEFRRQFGVSH